MGRSKQWLEAAILLHWVGGEATSRKGGSCRALADLSHWKEETAPVTRGEIGGITQSNRRGTRRGKGVLSPTESVARPPQVWEDL